MSNPYKVRIADIEAGVNSGGGPCYPDVSRYPNLNIVSGDGYSKTSGISSHATAVMGYLQPAATLIDTILVFNDSWFCGKTTSSQYGLNESRPDTFPPGPSCWDIETGPFGMVDPLFSYDFTANTVTYVNGQQVNTPIFVPGIVTREQIRLKRDNILGFFGPPDGGMQDYPIFCHINSPFALRIGSTITSMVLNDKNMPDVYMDVPYTSYAIPAAAAAVGVPMVSWGKTNWASYSADVLKEIIISTAVKNSKGQPVVSATKALNALMDYVNPPTISAPVPVPPPAPTPAPVVVTPTPPPVVTPTPAPTPVPVVSPAPVPAVAAVVKSVYCSNAWSGLMTPTHLSWTTSGVSAIVTDSNGVAMKVPANGSLTIDAMADRDGPYGYHNSWTVVAVDAAGNKSAPKAFVLNGKFDADQVTKAMAN